MYAIEVAQKCLLVGEQAEVIDVREGAFQVVQDLDVRFEDKQTGPCRYRSSLGRGIRSHQSCSISDPTAARSSGSLFRSFSRQGLYSEVYLRGKHLLIDRKW